VRDVAQLLIVARLLVVVLVAGWLAGCAGAGGRGRGRGRGRAGRAGRGVAPTRARVKGGGGGSMQRTKFSGPGRVS
jgi:hypothetical protein